MFSLEGTVVTMISQALRTGFLSSIPVLHSSGNNLTINVNPSMFWNHTYQIIRMFSILSCLPSFQFNTVFNNFILSSLCLLREMFLLFTLFFTYSLFFTCLYTRLNEIS